MCVSLIGFWVAYSSMSNVGQPEGQSVRLVDRELPNLHPNQYWTHPHTFPSQTSFKPY